MGSYALMSNAFMNKSNKCNALFTIHYLVLVP